EIPHQVQAEFQVSSRNRLVERSRAIREIVENFVLGFDAPHTKPPIAQLAPPRLEESDAGEATEPGTRVAEGDAQECDFQLMAGGVRPVGNGYGKAKWADDILLSKDSL